MYCTHFGLHRPPFNNTPDPSFYYSTPDHEEALATLQYATVSRKGFVLVTGEVGAGKTLIGRMFVRQMDRQASTAVITHTQLNSRQLLSAICGEFELEVPPDATNLQLADLLQEFLLEQFARDRFVVVLLDEAQNLPDESFEALRMLGNLEADDAKLLQVCILGQPELRDRFRQDSMRQLDQRLFRRFHLSGLTEQQSSEYIQRRLQVAGCARADLFTPEALEKVYAASHGIPRVINQICDNALLAAYAQGRRVVEADVIAQVLEQEGLSQQTWTPESIRGASGDEATQARIEQIYGSRPEMVEAASLAPAASGGASGDSIMQLQVSPDLCTVEREPIPPCGLRDVVQGAVAPWPAVKEAIERQRLQIQQSIQDATDHWHDTQNRIQSVADTSVSTREVQELRDLHEAQARSILGEISESREGMRKLVEATDARVAETQARLTEVQATAASRERVDALEQQQVARVQGTITQMEEYRRHIEELVDLLRQQCDQTQCGLAGLSDSCASLQTELTERVDDRIALLEQELGARLRKAARADDVAELRDTHIRTRRELTEEFEAKLADIQNRIQQHVAASTQETQGIRETQTRAQADLDRQLETRLTDLQDKLAKELGKTARAEELELIRSQQSRVHLETAMRMDSKLAQLHDTMQEQLDATATLADIEALRRGTVNADELGQVREEAVRGDEAVRCEVRTEIAQVHDRLETRLGESSLRHEAGIKDLSRELVHQSQQLEGLAAETAQADQAIRGEVRTEIAQVHKELENRLTETSQRHEAVIEDLSRGLDHQSRQLEGLAVETAQADQAIRGEVRTEIAQVHDQLENRLNQTTQRHEAVIEDLSRGLVHQSQQLEGLAEETAQADQAIRGEVRTEIAQVHDQLENRLNQTSERHEAVIEDLSRGLVRQSQHLKALAADTAQADQAVRSEVKADLELTRSELKSQLDDIAEQQQVAVEKLASNLERHAHEVETLAEDTGVRLTALQTALSGLEADSVDSATFEQVRQQYRTSMLELQSSIDERARELGQLREAMDAQAGRLSAEQQETTNSLSTRIDEHERQLRQLRQRLIESHTAVQDRFNEIEEQFVRREDLEQVRQDHAAQAAALVEQIETNRHAVQDAMQDITERFRLIHTRLEGLDESAQADSTGLSELRRTQAEDVGNLLRQLEDQRRAVQEQFDRILSGWSRSQQEIEHLRSTAANVNALDELRKRQHRQSEQVLNVIAEQRQNVEVLIQAIGGRCDEMLKRIDALPANIATTDDVKALHAQTLDQKAMIEAAIRGVSMQCEQTAGALRNLETSAASVEDIRQIRESQAANLDQIVQRLDGQSSEYQQEFETLNQRWTHLREELHTLAQSSTSVKQFETAERMITQDLGSLKERLAEVAQRRQKDARILVDAVQRLTERVKGLEELDRPMPVKIELRPRAAEELGELNKSAETRAADMRALLATADAMGSQLRDSSTHVEEIIRDWLNTARQVNEQSEQLRTSAVSSGSILQALRKCNETIDGKLKSPAWHGQLRRAEEIAARLEQALPHYAHVEETIQHWEKRRGEAEHFVDRLESLLAEAGKVTARLGRVGVMMAGVAGKASSLAETVESARAHDEQLRPARSPGANGGNRAVQDVDWPRYRTHAAAQ